MGGELLAAAAWVAVFGLPVRLFLTTTDPAERAVLAALSTKARAHVDELQRAQATHIANAMVRAKL